MFATAEAGPLTNPENAKNCLATVACGDSPNQESLYYYGTGPTTDGRRKPEIAAGLPDRFAANGSGCGTVALERYFHGCPMVPGMATPFRQYFTSGYYPTGAAVPGNALNPSALCSSAIPQHSAVRMSSQAAYLIILPAGAGCLPIARLLRRR